MADDDNPRKVTTLTPADRSPDFDDLDHDIEDDLDEIEGEPQAVPSPVAAEPDWPVRLPFGTRYIAVDRIVVGERFRKDFGDLQVLADSIMDVGLLQPIGVTQDWQLVFGERRLRAVRDILQNELIEARVVDVPSILAGEHAENEIRHDFTPSERVAIADALKAQLGAQYGSRVGRPKEIPDRGPELSEAPDPEQGQAPPSGELRDLAAHRAGFESGRQLDRATNVVKLAIPAVVEAMDRGDVSITAAAEIAKAAPADQAQIVALPEPERLEEIRRRKADAARLRAAAADQEKTTGPTAYTGFLKKNGRLPDKAEAETIATLDHRETPAEGGKRVKPSCAKTTKEQRAEKKILDGYEDEIWRTQQACQLLFLNKTDPATLMQHVSYIEKGILDEKLRAARAWLNAFAREYRRHAK